MAACYENITFEQCRSMMRFIIGMNVSKTWRGYGNTLFMELGKLKRVKTSRRTTITGQTTIMMQSAWRVEGPRSIHLGSSFGEKTLARKLSELVGYSMRAIEIDNATRELVLSLSDGQALRTVRTFTEDTSQPQWTVLVEDCGLVELDRVWAGVDVTPCIHIHAGRPRIEYCFDESGANLRELGRRYQLAK